jgi:hypothetical protein
MGVALNVDSLADPTLVPGQKIQVMGIGERLRGTYVIFKQTITLGGSGSTMSLECRSNASKIGGVEARGRAAQEKKEKEVGDKAAKILIEALESPVDTALSAVDSIRGALGV